MFYWIYDYPIIWVGALFAVATVAITLGGIALLGPTMRAWLHADRPANEAIGYILASFSVLYGILLGLLAVESYQNYSTANDIVSREATAISALYRDFGGYPEPERGRLRESLRSYAQEVVQKSWPLQRKGLTPTHETKRVTDLFTAAIAFVPANKAQEILHAEALRQLNVFAEARRVRLNNINMRIPPILWWVVMMGALVHIVLIWMLDVRKHVHLLLGGLLSFYIGVVIFAIAAMDNPFRGEVSDGPEAIQEVVVDLMRAKLSAER